MLTSLSNSQNINFKGAGKAIMSLRHKPQELDALRREKATQETLFRQGGIGDCWVLAPIKSIMFALNEYANKTGKHQYNARNWLRKFVVFDVFDKDSGAVKICFPIKQNVSNKVISCMTFDESNPVLKIFSNGNKRVRFLEHAYGVILKVIDKKRANVDNLFESLKGGKPFLAMNDITGLKSFQLTQTYAATRDEKELFKEYTGKLFKSFKKHPENLAITLSTNKNSIILPENHAFSLKKVVDDGLIIIDPNSKTNEEIKIGFDHFYSYFDDVDFARLQPEKMFSMIEKAKKITAKALTNRSVFTETPTSIPVRDSRRGILKNKVYFDV